MSANTIFEHAPIGTILSPEECRFLVPSAECDVGRFGFVVDPDRNAVYAGPSSVVGWQGRGSP